MVTTAQMNTAIAKAIAAHEAKYHAAPPPVVTPTPTPPSGKVVTFGSSLTAQQLQNAAADMTVDAIELTAGTYKLGTAVYFDVDRTAKPLTIRPAAGASVTFTGSGDPTASGQFFFGLNRPSKYVTMQGFGFTGYLLAQAGIFEFRQTDHVTVKGIDIAGITRYTAYSDKAYKTWAAYISMVNTNLVLDGWTMAGVNRDWSGIQIDSGTSAAHIALTNIIMANLDYAFYEDVPTTDLTLDGWKVTNCGEGGVAISFHQAQGVYRNVALVGSGVISPHSSQMSSGGGNTTS